LTENLDSGDEDDSREYFYLGGRQKGRRKAVEFGPCDLYIYPHTDPDSQCRRTRPPSTFAKAASVVKAYHPVTVFRFFNDE